MRSQLFTKLFDTLAPSKTLTHLCLQWNTLTDVAHLSKLIKHGRALQLLDLQNTQLKAHQVTQLVTACKKAISLKSLLLSGNQLGNNLDQYH